MKKKLNNILLIDDDEPTNFINKMVIDDADCTEHVQVAQSGQSALDYIINSEHSGSGDKSFPCPDLIFLDINMPAMNGWEFLDKYNKLEGKHHGEIITVMLTTSINPDDELKANEMPCISGFEHKPLTAEKLNRIMRKHFGSYF